ncbi:ASKHA domain-containing protein [Sphaerochaeta halotolerans]|uniref:ASKHA domain-containing protein n=1 Tax=Sphaerochaeta halotolerans TaxID=2293840 RepID=UPI00136F11EF|nr:ASKHA domain-containing protein [Sphaerochaeta halotolerans]
MKQSGNLIVNTQTRTLYIPCETERALLELLMDAGISEISSPCGGNGLCGKCLVQVEGSDTSPVHDDERRLLTPSQLKAGLRLACRMMVGPSCNLTINLLNTEEDAQVVATFESGQSTIEHDDAYEDEVYGCAIDIGTTTVVVYLVRLDTHQVVDHRSAMNRQRAYGGDVISRIQYAGEHAYGLRTLQNSIVTQLDAMIAELLAHHKVSAEHLQTIVAVGNTTMIHLLVGADPAGIACAPFTPAFTEAKTLLAKELGFKTAGNAQLQLPGAVSAYVGSDITVGIQASPVMRPGKVVLYIDIGTNGEIVLWDGQRLHSCSSAAGPAFEGASIRQGMGAVPGAIDRVWVTEEGEINHTTIGGKVATGICGSAIIDTMALLVDLGLVDETGAMDSNHADGARYLVDSPDGSALKITDTVAFTSRDVREVQLAKAAIAAGADILLMEAKVKPSDLDAVLIAGGFGSYINISNAQRIGLLPPIARDKIVAVGNAAGKGALAVLMQQKAAKEVERIRQNTHYIELSTSMAFQERYVEHMMFAQEEQW